MRTTRPCGRASTKGRSTFYSSTLKQSDWANTVFVDHLDAVKRLKNSDGRDIQVLG
jgi:hypothetical protein